MGSGAASKQPNHSVAAATAIIVTEAGRTDVWSRAVVMEVPDHKHRAIGRMFINDHKVVATVVDRRLVAGRRLVQEYPSSEWCTWPASARP